MESFIVPAASAPAASESPSSETASTLAASESPSSETASTLSASDSPSSETASTLAASESPSSETASESPSSENESTLAASDSYAKAKAIVTAIPSAGYGGVHLLLCKTIRSDPPFKNGGPSGKIYSANGYCGADDDE